MGMSRTPHSAALREEIARLLEAERGLSAEILVSIRNGLPVSELRATRREVREALEDAYGLLHEIESTAHTTS
jgi:hypothetical protein